MQGSTDGEGATTAASRKRRVQASDPRRSKQQTPPKFRLIRKNAYLRRKPRPVDEDDIFVCRYLCSICPPPMRELRVFPVLLGTGVLEQ